MKYNKSYYRLCYEERNAEKIIDTTAGRKPVDVLIRNGIAADVYTGRFATDLHGAWDPAHDGVAHDFHNIIVAGVNDTDMAAAVKRVILAAS